MDDVRHLLIGLLLVALCAATPGRPATPDPLVYFAEDWDATARGDFPAARAAREAFVSRLAGVGVEDFEGRHGRVLEVPLGGYGGRISGGARDSVSSVAR